MNTTFEKWCEKLLDTGMGNRLINFKSSSSRDIQIFSPNGNELLDKITSNSTFTFYDVDAYLKRVKQEFNLETDKLSSDQIIATVSKSLTKKNILAYNQGHSMQKILNGLKKLASESLIEKGINILYMSFGLLNWTDKDNNKILSPLVLVPVNIEKDLYSSSFTVKQYEEEITTNPTLVYKLKIEEKIILPEFRETNYEEENLEEYYARLERILKKKNWSIYQENFISTFSFLKLNMYRDLKENEKQILNNSLVKRLLNQKVDEESIDVKIDENSLEDSLHNVADADSSQMIAIMNAKYGKSFVLQGPPGTGKSQTITNLIAEFLYDGKKILFVSEKLAALKVVYNNLKRAGLSDFCLELHSNKTNKKEVINELNGILTRNVAHISPNALISVSELKKSENQLDSYVKSLHTKIEVIEKTPYEIMSEISRFRNAKPINFVFNEIDTKGKDYYKQAKEALEKFSRQSETVGFDYHKNVWNGFIKSDLTYEGKVRLKTSLISITNFISKFLNYFEYFESEIGLSINTPSDLEKYYEFVVLLSKLKFFDKNIFGNHNLNIILDFVRQINTDINKLKELEQIFYQEFTEKIFELDVNELYLRFENEYSGIFRFLKKKYRQDKNIICQYSVNSNRKLKYKKLLKYLGIAREIVNTRKLIQQDEQNIFANLYQDKDENSYNFEEILKELEELKTYDVEIAKNLRNVEKYKFIEIQMHLKEFINAIKVNNSSINKLKNLQEYFDKNVFCIDLTSFEEINKKCKSILDSFDELENWSKFYLVLAELDRLKLRLFVDKYISLGYDKSSLTLSFSLEFYKQWLYKIVKNNEIFSEFSRESQDMAVENFSINDKLRFEISKAEIITKLSNSMPDLNNLTSGSQISILAREAHKKTKQMPVRILLSEIGNLVQTLKPCFLMSPLSVSTYLDSNTCKFDVVIFDEASQIFPWDAIGAISRANQLIVVGDSKQMPPSNFFNSGISEEETLDDEYNGDDALDFESILDLCASCFNQNSLNWHYRSKTEDLIAFSNYNFYNNSLVTFPSPKRDNLNMGIHFHFVKNGIFNRKTKDNILEAEKTVELIFDHFKNFPNLSLGVVAFSVSQQEAIEDLIQKKREENDEFAEFFDGQREEPFFVKNLETVQGDERDTIIFSIAYAKGDDGRFIHNFGPLNQKGGERRLNVAITRAKYSVELVSSIRSYDIDLNKTSSVGAKLLKDYLYMAETGASNWVKLNSESDYKNIENPKGYIESEICEFLTQNGFETEMNVGSSECKIDIAVKDSQSKEFIVAIECDGETYKKGKTTRDRDRLRREVLERLGWKYYRIWSIEWCINKKFEKERLLKFIQKAMYTDKNCISKQSKILTSNTNKSENNSFLVQEKFKKRDLKSLFPVYEEYKINYLKNPTFNKVIYDLVAKEAPITEELLLKKTVTLFGKEKVTALVRNSFATSMKNFEGTIFKIDDYYVVDKNMKIQMRVPKQNASPRDIMLISNAELESGLYTIISNSAGINEKGLFLTIANLLGFSRIGNNIQKKLKESIQVLLEKNLIKQENNEYFVSK